MMQTTIQHLMRSGGLMTAVLSLGVTFGTPAMACNSTRMPGGAMPLNKKVASLRMLGITHPPKLDGREHANAAQPVQQQIDAVNPTIVGLWQVMDLENGQPVDLSFELWHADGTEVLIDQTPPAEGNVCVGTWLQTGTLTYRLTHPALNFDMNGNFIGTVMIRETVTLDRTGNKFDGNYTVDVYDTMGEAQAHFEGELTGKRVNP